MLYFDKLAEISILYKWCTFMGFVIAASSLGLRNRERKVKGDRTGEKGGIIHLDKHV